MDKLIIFTIIILSFVMLILHILKVFRGGDYGKEQILLLPYSVNEFVDANSPVRVLDEIIDSMDHSELLQKYKGGGG